MPTVKPPKPNSPPPPKKGKGLTFPPLLKDWTVKGEPNWPGAEYTRRTRLKTHLTEDMSAEFVDEIKELLGATNFEHFESAMQPHVNRKYTRGMPPAEKGNKVIQKAYVLPRAETPAAAGGSDEDPLMSTTLSLSGKFSMTKTADSMHSPWGYVPNYMFEDRERMKSLDEWFGKYGRPTPNAINLGPRQLYTHYDKSSKRCCGEESNVTIMKKGFVTA